MAAVEVVGNYLTECQKKKQLKFIYKYESMKNCL